MCSGDEEKDIKIEFFISQKSGKHKNIGSVLFNIKELRDNLESYQLPMVKSPNGQFTLQKTKIQKRNTFLEYIFGGCEINLAIAIDFTLSNGPIDDPASLHTKNLNRN